MKNFIIVIVICMICQRIIECHTNSISIGPSQRIGPSKYDLNETDYSSNSHQNVYKNSISCDKSQLAALLISIFVGGLGADRFYLDYVGLGVGKLILLVGTSCVVCCVAIIIILSFAGCAELSAARSDDATRCFATGSFIMIIFFVLLILFAIAALMGSLAWYIYDIVQIATGALLPNGKNCYAQPL